MNIRKSKKSFLKAAFFFIFTILVFSIFSFNTGWKTHTQDRNAASKSKSYDKEWKKVDAFVAKGLTRSALEITEEIYKKAKTEKNAPQLVKSILARLRFKSELNENSEEEGIASLLEELKSAYYPLRPVLYSLLAESYQEYYQNNMWKVADRLPTDQIDQDDIATWDTRTFLSHAKYYYLRSLENTDSLKKTKLGIYDAVLSGDRDSRKFRPTLYDFMVHRALAFFSNDQSNLPETETNFELDNAACLMPHPAFLQYNFISRDSLSMKYHAIKLFQAMESFHQKDTLALLDLELKRLDFSFRNAVVSGKDSLYASALGWLENTYKNHPMSAAFAFERASLLFGNEYDEQKYSDDNPRRWDKKKAFTICQAAVKRIQDTTATRNCKLLMDKIKKSDISVITEEVGIPGKPIKGLIKYKNAGTVYFRICRMEYDSYRAGYDTLNNIEKTKKFLELNPVAEWSLKLPADSDYQQHSAEFKIPELPLGFYVMLTGSEKGFSGNKNILAWNTNWVSGISYLQKGGYNNNTKEVMILHRENGTSIRDAEIQLYKTEYNEKLRKYTREKAEKISTDENGMATIPLGRFSGMEISYTAHTPEGNNFADKLYVETYLQTQILQKEEERTVLNTFFFTDRAIYRPGQTIFLKGIVVERKGKAQTLKSGNKSHVVFYDVNNKEISSLNLVTNEYGSFTGSFTAPEGMLNGRMKIADANGEAYVSVEEYKRPKFEVKLFPLAGQHRVNDSITMVGSATSYSGSKISHAEVVYHVIREATSEGISGDQGLERWSPYHGVPAEMVHGTTVTNDTGGFFIRFMAIPEKGRIKKYNPVFVYRAEAKIMDINGETHQAQGTCNVGYSALQLNMDVPETIQKESAGKIGIIATNFNDIPEKMKGKIEILKLKDPGRIIRERLWEKPDRFTMSPEEFYKNFPQDEYNDEKSAVTWETGKKVFEYNFDTGIEKTIVLSSLSSWESGAYLIRATGKDKFGEAIKSEKNITIFSFSDHQVPLNQVEWVQVLKKSVQPGEKAGILIGSAEKNVRALVEVEQGGKSIQKDWINLSNEQKLLEIPVEEESRGGFFVHVSFVKNNRAYIAVESVDVPFSNKELTLEFETFRNKLFPGEKEQWRIKINGNKGEKIAAEMMATLYDASLDQFVPHAWNFWPYYANGTQTGWNKGNGFETKYSTLVETGWENYSSYEFREYEYLNWFKEGYFNEQRLGKNRSSARHKFRTASSPGASQWSFTDSNPSKPEMKTVGLYNALTTEGFSGNAGLSIVQFTPPSVQEKAESRSVLPTSRKNLKETAFFFPQLKTDENGKVIISFTVPEALTRWKMLGLAHTKDLKIGQISNELITQKDLMVVPNLPRFFREGDKITLMTKISNLSDKSLEGDAQLLLYDAFTNKDITAQLVTGNALKKFTCDRRQNTWVTWELKIPEGYSAVSCKVLAKSGNFTDGEENTVPVLSNNILVTESLPVWIRGGQTKTFTLDKLLNAPPVTGENGATKETLRHHKLTFEFSSNPAWYAIQALPYMMEFPYECSEQTFSRYYANSIAEHITGSTPEIKAVVEAWKSSGSEAFLSNLQKNHELKNLLLEETPWVMEAKNESERKKRISLLFDLNHMQDERTRTLEKLRKMQLPSGAWPWFDGMEEDRYITQHIVCGLGHLVSLGIKQESEMLNKAIAFLDFKTGKDYKDMLKYYKKDKEQDHLGETQIQYLYTRSYFKDVEMSKETKEALDYYKTQARTYWMKKSRYMQGMIALALNRYEDKKTAGEIINSLRENAMYNEEQGMYWKENTGGWYWYEAPVETQALLIEAFDEVANDKKSVDEMRIWLLKNKQSNDWKTTKATAEAVYALLLHGSNWLSTETTMDILLGDKKPDPAKFQDTKQEAGTGYFKTSWSGKDIDTKMGNVTVSKKSEGISWGALYWQYFEQLDKITPSASPLHLKKQLFIEENTGSGPVLKLITKDTKLKTGDKIKVRIELRSDRDMEYVQMKDMRAAGFEPVNVLSGYKYQGGLGYYESTRDAATNFFFSHISKGTYVFEYPLIVNHSGDFSNGVTSIQCMYAPEFSSHSEGLRVSVK